MFAHDLLATWFVGSSVSAVEVLSGREGTCANTAIGKVGWRIVAWLWNSAKV